MVNGNLVMLQPRVNSSSIQESEQFSLHSLPKIIILGNSMTTEYNKFLSVFFSYSKSSNATITSSFLPPPSSIDNFS